MDSSRHGGTGMTLLRPSTGSGLRGGQAPHSSETTTRQSKDGFPPSREWQCVVYHGWLLCGVSQPLRKWHRCCTKRWLLWILRVILADAFDAFGTGMDAGWCAVNRKGYPVKVRRKSPAGFLRTLFPLSAGYTRMMGMLPSGMSFFRTDIACIRHNFSLQNCETMVYYTTCCLISSITQIWIPDQNFFSSLLPLLPLRQH